ncbi:transcription initiation factor IIE subunit alpha [[Candida] jaroonii]|uniref:Transcription initiation factor IIE subunit alpha n=1 Tax=[Candida] jaroonii TaxID=467808 RepID=A0ACA9Y074_9ASCO|nr:transcription initiation factor IIE subunit alpha [[Candida] jaroonii]
MAVNNTIEALLRFVVRGFYPKPCILVMEAVLIHSVLSEDDLMYLLGIQRKELRMFCNKLVEDKLLSTHIQKEDNPQQRNMQRTYYYIHITMAIDSIKWKVHSLVNKIKLEMSSYGNPQGYLCKRCGKKFSQLDAISLINDDKSQFLCDNCEFPLIEDDSSQQASIRQESLEKLMIQIDPIIAFLKKIDDSVIEDNSFESSLMNAIPAQSSGSSNFALPSRLSKSKNSTSSLTNKAQATLHVSITANDENEDREEKEREERRLKLEQNALPSWHSKSTVGKEIDSSSNSNSNNNSVQPTPEPTDAEIVKNEPSENSTPEAQEPTAEGKSDLKDKVAQDALAAYYANLAEAQANENEDDDDDDDDDDLDDFDDFEDL